MRCPDYLSGARSNLTRDNFNKRYFRYESERGAARPQHGSDCSGAGGAASGVRGPHADYLRRSLLLDVVEASRWRLLRSSADGRSRDPARHVDRGRYRTRCAAGLDPAGAPDELGDLRDDVGPVRRQAGGGDGGDTSERDAEGGGRHHDRHTGRAAVGRFKLRIAFARQGAADRARRIVAGGRRRRGLRVAVEIYRAVLRAGDPDLAHRGAETAALADLALALFRRPSSVG